MARASIILVALNILWSLTNFWDRLGSNALGKPSIKLITKDCPSDGGNLFTSDLQELLACSAIIRGDMQGLNEDSLSIPEKENRREALTASTCHKNIRKTRDDGFYSLGERL